MRPPATLGLRVGTVMVAALAGAIPLGLAGAPSTPLPAVLAVASGAIAWCIFPLLADMPVGWACLALGTAEVATALGGPGWVASVAEAATVLTVAIACRRGLPEPARLPVAGFIALRGVALAATLVPTLPHAALAQALARATGIVLLLVAAIEIAVFAPRRRMEAAQAETAAQASLARSRFLASASHDLRQPLQAVRLFHHLLAETLTGSRQRHLAAKIEESLNAASDILDALFAVAKLEEAGGLEPRIEAVALADIVAGVAAEHADEARGKGLDLRVVPSRAVVRTDRVLLVRMLGGLVSNALRYTERGRILIGCRHRGQRVCIEVWDTGIGIAENQIAAVFDELYQVDNPERNRARGLGLGLSFVARIGRLLGHPVTVRSQPGRGSVFSVSLPLAAKVPLVTT